MINKIFNQKDTNLSWTEIREIQKEGKFILPSDYIYLAANCNCFSFNFEDGNEYPKIILKNGTWTSFGQTINVINNTVIFP